MGNCKKRMHVPSNIFLSSNSLIGKQIQCPKCGFNFPSHTSYDTFNYHLDLCLTTLNFAGANANSFENTIKKEGSFSMWDNSSGKWEINKIMVDNSKFLFLKTAVVKDILSEPFPVKALWFRLQLEKLRIPWTAGSDVIMMRRDHMIQDSVTFINDVNMHKEIKIFFEAENVQDAGGLLREWVHLITKELVDKDQGVLTKACSKEVYYTLNHELEFKIETIQKCKLLGKVIGKALFDHIPLNFSLSHPSLKQMLGKKIELSDIKTLDHQLYDSWIFLSDINLEEEVLDQDFTYFDNKTGMNIELKPNGKDLNVTEANKLEFIELSLSRLIDRDLLFKQTFLDEFHQIIPLKLLQVFTVPEFEMLISGLTVISVDEWQRNTQYKGLFNEKHKVVQWFWSVMRGYNQEALSKILMFSTGSSKPPIEGFAALESNRGTLTKFCIEGMAFKKENPFVKAHTCFNRLEIPSYGSLEELKMYMDCIVNNNFEGIFGLD